MRRLPVLLGLAAVQASCVSTYTGLVPHLALSTVQRPSDTEQRWGNYTLTPADSSGYLYEDGLIKLAVVPLRGTFSAVIENKTEHSIRLNWSEASYVGPDGVATGLVPGDTRWMDFGDVPAPHVIPARARASIVAIPKATANTSSMTIGSFYEDAVNCEEIKASELRLVLPIEIQGVTNEYSLMFTPREVERVTYQLEELSRTTKELDRVPCD